MDIRIEEYVANDKLQRRVWGFYFNIGYGVPSYITMRLEYFLEQSKSSTRHRVWKNEDLWRGKDVRGSTLKREDLHIPSEIIEKAKQTAADLFLNAREEVKP